MTLDQHEMRLSEYEIPSESGSFECVVSEQAVELAYHRSCEPDTPRLEIL